MHTGEGRGEVQEKKFINNILMIIKISFFWNLKTRIQKLENATKWEGF